MPGTASHLGRALVSSIALSALLVLLGPAPTAFGADGGWINDRSESPPRLSVEQSIWAMGGLPRGSEEWSLEEKFAKIAGAKFDGVMVFLPGSEREEDQYRELARENDLAITLQCAPSTSEDIERAIQAAKRMEARAVVAMIQPTFVTYTEGEAKIRAMSAACDAVGLPFYIETHRGTITQDLPMTSTWARTIPGIRIHADLSHYAVAYEIGGKPSEKIASLLAPILARTGMLDGRIGNGEQVQVDIGPDAENPHAKRFAGWWKTAMKSWLEAAKPGDVFVFKSELGPPAYSIVDLEGRELSDRWAQAIVMRDLAIRTWNDAVRETGKGAEYAPGKDRRAGSGAPGKSDGALDRENALSVKDSPIRTLRGESHRIGEFHLAGQPLQPDFDDAKEQGIRSVINLRMEQELGGLGFDEEDYIQNTLGLAYYWIPVAPQTIDDEMAEKLIRAIDEAPKPVLIHDSNENRPWGVWALYVGTKFGVPLAETKRAAEEHGVEKLVIDKFVSDWLQRKKKTD